MFRTECKECLNRKRRETKNYGRWHKSNKVKVKKYMRNYDLLRKYGITDVEYQEILTRQDNKCCICKTTEFCGTGNKLHVDHCHESNKIRGLLCSLCNVGLGHFRDSIIHLESAINYLKNI